MVYPFPCVFQLSWNGTTSTRLLLNIDTDGNIDDTLYTQPCFCIDNTSSTILRSFPFETSHLSIAGQRHLCTLQIIEPQHIIIEIIVISFHLLLCHKVAIAYTQLLSWFKKHHISSLAKELKNKEPIKLVSKRKR